MGTQLHGPPVWAVIVTSIPPLFSRGYNGRSFPAATSSHSTLAVTSRCSGNGIWFLKKVAFGSCFISDTLNSRNGNPQAGVEVFCSDWELGGIPHLRFRCPTCSNSSVPVERWVEASIFMCFSLWSLFILNHSLSLTSKWWYSSWNLNFHAWLELVRHLFQVVD